MSQEKPNRPQLIDTPLIPVTLQYTVDRQPREQQLFYDIMSAIRGLSLSQLKCFIYCPKDRLSNIDVENNHMEKQI